MQVNMKKGNGKNSITSKQFNRGLIFQLIATGTCNTRIELSRRTGLAKTTVTNIVAEFLEKGIVKECEEAIKIDAPGPVLFIQKRIEQNKKYFKLHKFRFMKMCTTHDVPTHQLENPEQYITRAGKFLRSHSLDEPPKIWDIFIGDSGIIGITKKNLDFTRVSLA